MYNLLMLLIRRTRLALQEFGPYMGLLMLPGGYLIALSGWVQRRWPLPPPRPAAPPIDSLRLAAVHWLHGIVEAHAAMRAMCRIGPAVCCPRSNRTERKLALRARRVVQQHDDRHESSAQGGQRKPGQPKAIGRKGGRQNAKEDAGEHEQHRLISAPPQIIPYRHGALSYGTVEATASRRA